MPVGSWLLKVADVLCYMYSGSSYWPVIVLASSPGEICCRGRWWWCWPGEMWTWGTELIRKMAFLVNENDRWITCYEDWRTERWPTIMAGWRKMTYYHGGITKDDLLSWQDDERWPALMTGRSKGALLWWSVDGKLTSSNDGEMDIGQLPGLTRVRLKDDLLWWWVNWKMTYSDDG